MIIFHGFLLLLVFQIILKFVKSTLLKITEEFSCFIQFFSPLKCTHFSWTNKLPFNFIFAWKGNDKSLLLVSKCFNFGNFKRKLKVWYLCDACKRKAFMLWKLSCVWNWLDAFKNKKALMSQYKSLLFFIKDGEGIFDSIDHLWIRSFLHGLKNLSTWHFDFLWTELLSLHFDLFRSTVVHFLFWLKLIKTIIFASTRIKNILILLIISKNKMAPFQQL